MEGPYRDLGSGFVRLTGIEGVRRSPSRIDFVEDALRELLHNAREAGAENIYVASSRRARRYRTLTVLDDGHGIPDAYKDLIFEPGVTTRHLTSVSTSPPNATPKTGSGVSLFHIKNTAINAEVLSAKAPTSIQTTFDTATTPERASQSSTRNSRTNFLGTIQTFISGTAPATPPNVHYGSPASVLASLAKNRIIHQKFSSPLDLRSEGERLGLPVSLRTAQRIGRGEVLPAKIVFAENSQGGDKGVNTPEYPVAENIVSEARFELDRGEISRIATILGEAARTRYLEVGEVKVECRPGEIVVRSRVYEPEEEYE